MSKSSLEKNISTLKQKDEREEWINSFSGINGRSTIGVSKPICKPVNLSDFVKPAKHQLGV